MIEALFLWGIIQSFLVFIMIPVVKNVKSNYLLSLIFLTTGLNILFQYLLRFTETKFDFARLLVVPDILDLILPTLLYIYLIKIFGDFTSQKQYAYFFPPIVWTIVLTVFLFKNKDFEFYTYINTEIHYFSLILVFLWKQFLLFKAFKYFNRSGKFSKNSERSLRKWTRTLVLLMGLITFVSFYNLSFLVLKSSISDLDSSYILFLRKISNLNYIIFTCSIIFISIYFFIKHPKILVGIPSIGRKTSNQASEKFLVLERKLKAMGNGQEFFDTELNESELADRLGIKSYLLSKFLNEKLGKSFNEFINEKRIEKAKKLLEKKENQDLTIFAIAVDSGFGTESSFYSNFKKYTGMTPNQYKTKFSNVS